MWRLISWNTAGRRTRADKQVEWLESRSPDVVALQEVTPASRDQLRAALEAVGFIHQVDTFDRSQGVTVSRGPRKYGLLLAARAQASPLEHEPTDLVWPERMLSVKVRIRGEEVEIHTVHVPPGATNGWIKIETFEGIHARLARPSILPRILCGDLNSPQREFPDGTVVTWGQRVRKNGRVYVRSRIRGQPGERWDAGERSVLCRLAEYDLRDTYRALHGYENTDFSWAFTGRVPQRRFDHVFSSASLMPARCLYHHDPRLARLSDHCPIEVDYRQPGGDAT